MSTPDNQKTASDRGASSGHNPLTIPRVGAHLIEGAGPAADLDGVWELLDVCQWSEPTRRLHSTRGQQHDSEQTCLEWLKSRHSGRIMARQQMGSR